MGITKYLEEISQDFLVFGLRNGERGEFEKEVEYTAFVVPIVRIDSSLEKYKEMPIFQNKVDKANETLRTVGLPKLVGK